MNIPSLGISVCFILCMTHINAQDWPQFLGPERNSKSPQKNILRTWPETGPEVLWSVGVGIGYGGPVVRDGRVYLLDRDDQVGDYMRCFDLSTGEELWSYGYEAPGSVMFPGSRSVPAIDGNCVYSCGPYGDLYCMDINIHEPVWHRNVWTDFGGGEIPTWAISQCPLVYGELLILASQAPEAGVVAYDKHTGEVKWATPSLGLVGYVSPAIVKVDGEDQVVMITASGREGEKGNVVGMEPLTGKILWNFADWECRIPIPSAVDAGENRILIAGGYELGALMLRIEKKEDGSYLATELYRTEEFGDQTKPPLLHNGYFYAQYGTNNRRDGLVCMSMDGRILWKTKRSPDFNKGSMILADGVILATDGATTLYLIEPDTTAFKPLASSELLATETNPDDPMASRFGTQNWGAVALAEGMLLIRDQGRLLCVKVVE
ncbi:MAG: PQQ-like beta-propeller repeat protein [Bacteroidales bacterium]|nr:PQQ-like beta-propeller repeat protein [Bacteroidales bacterium]